MVKVEIYTDGSCAPNPGPGGWAAILIFGAHKREMVGGSHYTTNNQMELMAAFCALKTLKQPCNVHLYTDSQYLRLGITQWVKTWVKNGWRTREGKLVKNRELWEDIYYQSLAHTITWHWVRGHSGNLYNERVDQLATKARERFCSEKGSTNGISQIHT